MAHIADHEHELEDCEGEADEDVDDVAPAAEVEELTLGVLPQPFAVGSPRREVEGSVGMGRHLPAVEHLHAPTLGPRDVPRQLDTEADDGDTHEKTSRLPPMDQIVKMPSKPTPSRKSPMRMASPARQVAGSNGESRNERSESTGVVLGAAAGTPPLSFIISTLPSAQAWTAA